jgi:CheY-like chemotaxis protein
MDLKRILLVEDSAQDVELVLDALSQNNIANEVVVVKNGQEALDYLLRRGDFKLRAPGLPAVVLLDLKLPKLGGLEVLRVAKTDESLKMVPVVMLTSSREDKDLERAYALGANAYVVKPVKFSEFVDAMKELGCFWALVNEPPPGSIKRGGAT